jgi:hypothetical protein
MLAAREEPRVGWVVLLLVGVGVPAVLYGISALLDRRAARRGRRPWRGRRELRLLDRAARTQAGRSPQGFLTDTKHLGDAYDVAEGKRRHPPHPKDPAP